MEIPKTKRGWTRLYGRVCQDLLQELVQSRLMGRTFVSIAWLDIWVDGKAWYKLVVDGVRYRPGKLGIDIYSMWSIKIHRIRSYDDHRDLFRMLLDQSNPMPMIGEFPNDMTSESFVVLRDRWRVYRYRGMGMLSTGVAV